MTTSIIGYPRIGAQRELKFATEKFFKKELSEADLQAVAATQRQANWQKQAAAGIDFIASNDFSFYDTTLDTAFALNIVPKRYQELAVSPLERYFAAARGHQSEAGDVKALAMKKWFNTNYHYMVPEFDDGTEIKLDLTKLLSEYREALALGITTKPVLIGPFTLLKLIRFTGQTQLSDVQEDFVKAYSEILSVLATEEVAWLQLDEPGLVFDLTESDIHLFKAIYTALLPQKQTVKVLLQTYFGDVRDVYSDLIQLDFDGIGLDFVEGRKTAELIQTHGFPADKKLFAGVVNGKNIWRNDYQKTLEILQTLPKDSLIISTSCSLQHVPYTVSAEPELPQDILRHFAFAEEKLLELKDLNDIFYHGQVDSLTANQALFASERYQGNQAVQAKVAALGEADFTRTPTFAQREAIQKDIFQLPKLPTTTIGSFPQTADVRKNRLSYKRGDITKAAYDTFNQEKTKEWIKWQEAVGFDILVHGEFERNDMVEYFGEKLDGYVFTKNAWVQSYGTRCVKPPIVWGDIARVQPLSVADSVYAQSLTDKPLKGMLTGPVTILNWSFPREDISLKASTLQIALAIQEEVLDLEQNGIKIIQIDEAALREKLPLRQTDWNSEYLDWAIPAFRLVHAKVAPETQIHTHMCYSEFTDIIPAIDAMDADVISFEASRSDLSILDALQANGFRTQSGPGVYDIHSPRIPSVEEIQNVIRQILTKVPAEKLWINPDCGLKTRGVTEVKASLENLVKATQDIRAVL
ncbi:5-methyltetrahydropteroyltriglutamate--homocysteine S-methyltransferase [Pseudolactococcus raffinolactis]|jgi:5-methyltetrahydropteroyltriglutamate--homocysteine methyltransferase|uniref:5-methyltetrahydropteroyltriglutamate--homocysteine methyltransferase n=1 Tax=Pseudolactococcus raffinolactis TaxID=1366 RepID=A0A2A5S8L2_9LACT|nr:5-methyltetrahydropteroyltriglutamate--homocysteine S-methyltransferase [Lactococcus raffinolactis]MBP6301126.1 5-methyltetrahydropteroyltriglutamate--homocysteine S-methyltransferase [Lactococcus sp.]ATC62093.1 5-methyltetrahydropteroyltriglutamate--homocysteine S-methyltransferase [Lactococcus raffinolactis]MBR2541355.1 5-methyltetrahydropteroyltriglutamate--homocysteine S-methyltransferase [Lactococcus sp.]MBW9329878.1 5-methyltetrahydropteroyltriglutamate--homocysteine S-methyltransferas